MVIGDLPVVLATASAVALSFGVAFAKSISISSSAYNMPYHLKIVNLIHLDMLSHLVQDVRKSGSLHVCLFAEISPDTANSVFILFQLTY